MVLMMILGIIIIIKSSKMWRLLETGIWMVGTFWLIQPSSARRVLCVGLPFMGGT